jgi:hypothetical protein
VLTTFYSYGAVGPTRQAEIFGDFGKKQEQDSAMGFDALVEAVASRMAGNGSG